jgi:hypothetical protein
MTRSPLLILAALGLAACSDNPNGAITGPADAYYPMAPSPSYLTVSGRISVIRTGDNERVELHDGDGRIYRLTGAAAVGLLSLDSADVIASGTAGANPGFVVHEFTVTGMYGRPALDGLLEAIDGGFAIRLADGTLRAVAGLTSECAEHLGFRVWVIGWDESVEVQLGVIPSF